MGDENQNYVVEYLDDNPEETNWLQRSGVVKISYPNYDIFEGNVDHEKLKQGQGKYTWNKLEDEEVVEYASYQGEYVNGKKHGLGKMIFPNGDSYHGLWENNLMHGKGTYEYVNGDIYSGEYKKNIKEGEGSYEYAVDKSQFVGTWENGYIVKGYWKYADGTKYCGSFDHGQPIGTGVYIFSNGFQQEGVYTKDENGTSPNCIWKGGEISRREDINICP